MKKLLLAFGALIVGSGTASAADLATINSVPVLPASAPLYSPTPAHDWRGLYVGGSLGYVAGAVTGPITGNLSGLDVDVHAQYNFQNGNWVFGPFLAVPFPTATATIAVPVKINWAVVAGGRLGYAMGRWLPYVFAGGVVGGGTASTFTATHTGYTIGLGVDYALDDRWSVGARFAHVSLGKQPYGGLGSYGWEANSIAATLNFKLY